MINLSSGIKSQAGSESRPPMLNKENYVPWSSCLLRYAKIRPNGKLIHNYILNGPYVRRMIPEPGDANRETILLGFPKDIYAAVDICETAQEIWLQVQQMMKGFDIGIQEKKANQNGVDMLILLIKPRTFTQQITLNYPTTVMNMALALMAKAFKLNYSSPTNNNQRISSNPRNRQITQSGINMGQDRQMQMVRVNGGNQFRQYAGQNVRNLTGYNDVIRNRVIQNPVQNPRKEEAGIQLQAEEYDLMAASADLDEIEEVNANCILMANLQQASTSGTQTESAHVYDTDRSAEVHENYDDNEIFNMFTQEEQYTKLLKPILESHQVPQNDNDVISKDTSVEQGGEIVE
nr:hypothetical protein [Tanacetum cinerariifolium]